MKYGEKPNPGSIVLFITLATLVIVISIIIVFLVSTNIINS